MVKPCVTRIISIANEEELDLYTHFVKELIRQLRRKDRREEAPELEPNLVLGIWNFVVDSIVESGKIQFMVIGLRTTLHELLLDEETLVETVSTTATSVTPSKFLFTVSGLVMAASAMTSTASDMGNQSDVVRKQQLTSFVNMFSQILSKLIKGLHYNIGQELLSSEQMTKYIRLFVRVFHDKLDDVGDYLSPSDHDWFDQALKFLKCFLKASIRPTTDRQPQQLEGTGLMGSLMEIGRLLSRLLQFAKHGLYHIWPILEVVLVAGQGHILYATNTTGNNNQMSSPGTSSNSSMMMGVDNISRDRGNVTRERASDDRADDEEQRFQFFISFLSFAFLDSNTILYSLGAVSSLIRAYYHSFSEQKRTVLRQKLEANVQFMNRQKIINGYTLNCFLKYLNWLTISYLIIPDVIFSYYEKNRMEVIELAASTMLWIIEKYAELSTPFLYSMMAIVARDVFMDTEKEAFFKDCVEELFHLTEWYLEHNPQFHPYFETELRMVRSLFP